MIVWEWKYHEMSELSNTGCVYFWTPNEFLAMDWPDMSHILIKTFKTSHLVKMTAYALRTAFSFGLLYCVPLSWALPQGLAQGRDVTGVISGQLTASRDIESK